MVNCARSFLRPLTSHQEALEWQSPPARALITTASWRRLARTGWVKSGSLATGGSTAKLLSKSYLARQRRRPTDSARGQEEKIAFSPRGRLFEMKMDKQRWQQIETLYHAALERPPDERAAFLADACADDSGLLREVEALLRYDPTEGGACRTTRSPSPRRRSNRMSSVRRPLSCSLDRASERTKSWRCSGVEGWAWFTARAMN